MAEQQALKGVVGGNGKKAGPKPKERAQPRWLQTQSTGQLIRLLEEVTAVLQDRGLHLVYAFKTSQPKG